jgi:hypothetical protein
MKKIENKPVISLVGWVVKNPSESEILEAANSIKVYYKKAYLFQDEDGYLQLRNKRRVGSRFVNLKYLKTY